MKTLTSCLLALGLLVPGVNFAQTFSVTDSFTVNEMLGQLFGAGVSISNVTIQGDTTAAMGYFTGGSSVLGMPEGVILSTGNVLAADDSAGFASAQLSAPGDADLAALTGLQSFDAFVLEFDIQSSCDTIVIEYVFGSEEYPSFVGSFNDAFAFWITGAGYSGMTNIALVPGTSTPVSINTVNNSMGCTNCQYFVSNAPSVAPIAYGGYTTPLQAIATVNPDSTYHIKLAISDMLDGILDSGVFLRRKGVCANAGLVSIANATPESQPVFVPEGGNVTIELERALPFDQAISVSFLAAGDVDVTKDILSWPASVTIPAGEAGASFDITANADCEGEGTELLGIIYTDSTLACSGKIHSDTIWVGVVDVTPPLPTIDVGPPIEACIGDTIQLDSFTQPGYLVEYSLNLNSPWKDYFVVFGNDSIKEVMDFWGRITRLSDGCSSADTSQIISTPPAVSDMILPDIVCDGAAFDGLNASTGYVETYEWFLYSSGSATWTYNTPDINVQLMAVPWNVMFITGNTACGLDTAEAVVMVNPAVAYDTEGLADTVCVGEEVQWDLQIQNGMLEYDWDFGDGAIVSYLIPTHTYTDSGTYQIQVIGGYMGCADTVVHIVRAEVCSTDGIDLPKLNLAVYPNPAIDIIRIEGLQAASARITLYDMNGRLISEQNSSTSRTTISVKDLAAGMYVVHVVQENGYWSGRVEVR